MEIEKEQMREIIKKQKETKFILKNMETLDIDKNKLTKIKESLKKSLIS
jgi:hypothetical protein